MVMKKVLGIISILVVIAMLFAACGSNSGKDQGQTPQSGNTSSSEKTNETKTEDTKAEQTVPNVELPKGGHVEAVKQLPEKPLRIAFLSFQNNPFWFPVRDGALAAKEYLKNFNTTVDYIVMGEDMTADRVIAAMETAIAKQYDL